MSLVFFFPLNNLEGKKKKKRGMGNFCDAGGPGITLDLRSTLEADTSRTWTHFHQAESHTQAYSPGSITPMSVAML